MSKNPNQKPSLVSESDIIYACKVLDAVTEALDRAAAKPQLIPQLSLELLKKSPDILDALLTLTIPDCRPVVYDLGKAALRLARVWIKLKKKPS